MLSYWLKCWKNSESKHLKAVKTKSRRIMIWSNCAVCGTYFSFFISNQAAKGLTLKMV